MSTVSRNDEALICSYMNRECNTQCRAFHVFADGSNGCMREINEDCSASALMDILDILEARCCDCEDEIEDDE